MNNNLILKYKDYDDNKSNDILNDLSNLLNNSIVNKYLYKSYRIAFIIDASPSLASLDSDNFEIYFQTLHKTLTTFCQLLIMSIDNEYETEIYISVIALDATTMPINVLVHSLLLTKQNFRKLSDKLNAKLYILISEIATNPSKMNINYKSSISKFLNYGLLTINRMPLHCAPIVFILTDGVLDFLQVDQVLNSYIKHNIPCNIIQTSNVSYSYKNTFGYITDPKSLSYISHYTGGLYYNQSIVNELEQALLQCYNPNFDDESDVSLSEEDEDDDDDDEDDDDFMPYEFEISYDDLHHYQKIITAIQHEVLIRYSPLSNPKNHQQFNLNYNLLLNHVLNQPQKVENLKKKKKKNVIEKISITTD